MSIVILIAMTFVIDFSDYLGEHSDTVIKLGVNQNCNSSLAICSASIINEGNFQRISFTIKSLDSSHSKELKMMLTVTGFDFEGIESISVLFEIRDEIMAETSEIPVILLIPDKSTHLIVPEKWSAIAQLPPSTEKNSDWRAIIRLKSSTNEYRAEFPFNPVTGQ